MNKNLKHQTENKMEDSFMRRGFLKTAALLGLGTVAAGAVNGYAANPQGPEKKKGLVLF